MKTLTSQLIQSYIHIILISMVAYIATRSRGQYSNSYIKTVIYSYEIREVLYSQVLGSSHVLSRC